MFIIGTYDEDGTANAMNAAWGGVAGSNKVSMSLSPGHKTVKNILARKAFTISMADAAHVVEADYVGIVSGNEVPDKLARAGFTTFKSEFVDAPLIEELPLALECKLVSYDASTHLMIGEVVNVCADERILDANGMIDPTKLEPITLSLIHISLIGGVDEATYAKRSANALPYKMGGVVEKGIGGHDLEHLR